MKYLQQKQKQNILCLLYTLQIDRTLKVIPLINLLITLLENVAYLDWMDVLGVKTEIQRERDVSSCPCVRVKVSESIILTVLYKSFTLCIMCSLFSVSGPLDDGTIAAVVLVLIALVAACVILAILYRRGALKKKCWDKNYEEVDHKKDIDIRHTTLVKGPPVPDSNPSRRCSVPNNNGTCTPVEDIPGEHGGAVNPAYLSNGETEAMPTPPPGGESSSPDYTSMNSKQYAHNIPRCSTLPDSNKAIYMSNPPIAIGGDSGIVDDFGESSTDVPDDNFLKTIIRSNSYQESEQSYSLSSRVRSTSECLQSVTEECIPPPDEFTADLSVSGLDVDLPSSVTCLAHTPYHETLTESPGDDNTTSALSSLQRAAAECLAHTREVSANDNSQDKQYTTIDMDVPRKYENPNVDKGITTPWLEHTDNTNVSVENSGSSND